MVRVILLSLYLLLLLIHIPGAGSQGRAECNGKSWSSVPADRAADDPDYADTGQNGPLGGFPAEALAETLREISPVQIYIWWWDPHWWSHCQWDCIIAHFPTVSVLLVPHTENRFETLMLFKYRQSMQGIFLCKLQCSWSSKDIWFAIYSILIVTGTGIDSSLNYFYIVHLYFSVNPGYALNSSEFEWHFQIWVDIGYRQTLPPSQTPSQRHGFCVGHS